MKKSLLAMAALTAFAGVASAQSSVTLTGVVDAGIIRSGTGPNGNTSYDTTMGPSQSGYSSFTLRGTEDMGGGMRANFWLNSRFRIQNGRIRGSTNTNGDATTETATIFRDSWVGLSGGFGEVRLGRLLMPLQVVAGVGDTAWNTGTQGSPFLGGLAATIRANNGFWYSTPSFGGFSVQVGTAESTAQHIGEIGGNITASLAPQTGNSVRKNNGDKARPMGAAVRFSGGPVNVAAAWDKNAADMKTMGLYANYRMGAFQLSGQFESGDSCTSSTLGACGVNAVRAVRGGITSAGKEDIKSFSIGGKFTAGSLAFMVGANRINSDITNGDGGKVGLGAEYWLSRRTNLYTNVSKRSGDRFTDADRKAKMDLGITHRF